MSQFPFKSYCWVVGTTSFRTVDFNVQIERQLALLNEFWALPENLGATWREAQERYYRFMQANNFVKGDAKNPTKDAREKTSGLFAIGLIDDERKLTPIGAELLNVVQRGHFGCDNLIQLPADSFIYLKQMLKTSNNIEGNIVRPFVVTAYALLELDYLTDEEFTYLLPFCTTYENTKAMIRAIKDLRNGIGSIDEIIISRLMAMDNYRAALDCFLSEAATENVITAIGMNRKSGGTGQKAYDKPYHLFYELLRSVVIDGDESSIYPLYMQSNLLSGNPKTLWRQFLFKTTVRRKIEREGRATLNDNSLLRATSEQDFKRLFFERLHLFKARANLSDFFDLNRRYFKTTDTMIFMDGKVVFDVLPYCWLYSQENNLLGMAFSTAEKLMESVELAEISPFLAIDEGKIYKRLESLYGVKVANIADVNRILHDERYKRFNALVDERFGHDTLIDLLCKFESREYEAVRQIVTNNAEAPTIFEYILGIAWYLISDRSGDVLSYMKLSLEADLLPRSHAIGGGADIEYLYEETKDYPAHCLLLEATLSESTNQRRMEMEPVSRHLGDYILKTGDNNAYCVFVSTYLHHNVISDFRNRRTYEYYSEDYENAVYGLKIIPLHTKELRNILERRTGYSELYAMFDKAYRSNESVPTWYAKEVKEVVEYKARR